MPKFNSTAIRLLIVAALLPATYLVTWKLKAGLDVKGVQLPDWRFSALPLQLGEWHGQPQEMKPEIIGATEAAPGTTTSRLYQDGSGHAISMYGAMFDQPAGGVYHSPINCYRSSGWQKTSESREPLEVSDKLTFPVDVTTWDNPNGEKVMVVYWYQLGEHVLFGRDDLGLKVRWSMRGRAKWPALIKVMLSIPAPDPDEVKQNILDFAKLVAQWENQPEHRRQMVEKEAGESAAPRSSSKK